MNVPDAIENLCDQVRAHPRLLPHGARTKPALSTVPAPDVLSLDLSPLRGITEYLPEEFVLTALAGTPLSEVDAALAENRQYLPFDPLLVDRGATLGGTVAANLSGSGRYRYGGVRDFLIGIRFIDGRGRLLRGGGKVVKNAAGFDLPKLMVGSLGRLGVLIELTFKVFPRPAARKTLRIEFDDLEAAVAAICRLGREDWGLEAIDLDPPTALWLRFAGDREALDARSVLLERVLHRDIEPWGDQQPDPWHGWSEFKLLEDERAAWIKIPITPQRIVTLEAELAADSLAHRYSVGGQVAWLAWPQERLTELDQHLQRLQLSGLVLRPAEVAWRLGRAVDNPLLDRVRQALDPERRFLPFA